MSLYTPRGIATALVTPFTASGGLNLDMVPRLVERQVRSGISAVVVTAGSGEYVSLTEVERAEVVRAAVKAETGAIVVAGILAPDTTSAVAAARAARDRGAQALLLLTPYYITPSVEGVVDHFRLVADAIDLPILIYNNPGRTGMNLDLGALERLAQLPSVVGVKECDRDLGRVAQKIHALGERLAFLSGDDDLVLPFLSLGGRGAVMASTNLVASWAVQLADAIQEHDWDQARAIFLERLLKFVLLYKGPDHPGPLKQAMALAGVDVGLARPPLRPLNEGRLQQMSVALAELGLRKES